MQTSDHYDGERFFNLSGRRAKGLSDVLRWMMTRKRARWPEWVEDPHFRAPAKPDPGEVTVTFINHSTFLLQSTVGTLLTDPVFSERASPLRFAGPRRVRSPGVALSDLPKVDIVLVSHNHYDHMDLPTLCELERRHSPLFLTTLGNRAHLIDSGLKRVEEMDWWERVAIDSQLAITTTPAEHFSARGLRDRNRTLWAGFFLEMDGWRLFFASDSGYGEHFGLIRERLGPPDVAMLPIGAYLPRWFMRDVHMSPDDAVQAHLDLCAKRSIAMHFGTFQLSDEAFEQAQEDLRAALHERDLTLESFRILGFGESQCLRSGANTAQRENACGEY